jgi:signal transduction histidine kinase
LYQAIRQAVAEAGEQGLHVQLVFDGDEPNLPLDHVQVLTKAVEVGLDNVHRHAETHEAEITLTSEPSDVLLIMRDHGAGLLDGTAEPPGFHQLKRLRYRVQEIEGTLEVLEDDGGGVVLRVRVPCP